jgi:hypothetical protein
MLAVPARLSHIIRLVVRECITADSAGILVIGFGVNGSVCAARLPR